MKRTLTLIALVTICSAMTLSCKNPRTVDPTPEEILQQKQALADSVLAEIDEIADQLFNASSDSFRPRKFELTDKEKMVKPDYLLDPSLANTLLTRSQKINALSFYCIDNGIRKIYDMPCEESNEAIVKLAADLNFPLDMDFLTSEAPISEKMKANYTACKERGDLALFWQFEYAATIEIGYILAQNPELFFSRITDDQWRAYYSRKQARKKANEKLAKYDEEMAQLLAFREQNRVTASNAEREQKNKSVESVKQYTIANKEKYVAKRNALLQ